MTYDILFSRYGTTPDTSSIQFLILLVLLSVIGIGLSINDSAYAQSAPSDWPWKHVTIADSVRISYLFYSEADNENNGVVVKLNNLEDRKVVYSFVIVFRTEEGSEVESLVQGNLGPHQTKTGDSDGLFWIPFVDGRQLSEVGFRKLKFEGLE